MNIYTARIRLLIITSADAMEKNLEWRWGQSIYNTAWVWWPDIIRTMPDYVNPYQNDSKIDFFLQWLDEQLSTR
jgi:hypothetical protein